MAMCVSGNKPLPGGPGSPGRPSDPGTPGSPGRPEVPFGPGIPGTPEKHTHTHKHNVMKCIYVYLLFYLFCHQSLYFLRRITS